MTTNTAFSLAQRDPDKIIRLQIYLNKLKQFVAAILLVVSITGCNKNQIPIEIIPSVNTFEITDILVTDAICGGEITDNGGLPIISAGVCWSELENPTILNNVTTDDVSCDGTFLSQITGLEGGRTYYVRAYSENSNGIGYGQTMSFKTIAGIEEVSTESVTNLTDTSVTLNGKVIANMVSTKVLFEFGQTQDYGTELMFLQKSTQAVDKNFSVDVLGLDAGTTYHFRIKAINDFDTIFGDDQTFNTFIQDADNNFYSTIQIGNQTWMQENLRTLRYLNGDLIGTTPSPSLDITDRYNPQYQWPCSTNECGRYYTYYTITDNRKICPAGWHVPEDEEWIALTDYLSDNGYGFDGSSLKISKSLAAQSGWEEDSTPGNVGNNQESNNTSGFTGYASGGRYSNGEMGFVGQHGIWWSSTESSSNFAYFRCIGYLPGVVFRGHFNKSYGLPVRCVKDN